MAVVEGFDDKVIFIDQKEGILYSYNPTSDSVTKIYDVSATGADNEPTEVSIPHGGPVTAFSNSMFNIHQVSPGPDANSLFVVFTSDDLPSGYSHTVPEMPSNPEYHLQSWDNGDACNVTDLNAICGWGVREGAFNGAFADPQCCNGAPVYKLFYKFAFDGTSLSSPELFFALKQQVTYGHQGGGMVTIPSGNADAGKILFSVGDCLPFGVNGLEGAQSMGTHCAKMLLIDPTSPGIYKIAATGVRNSQQMNIEGDNLVFMDIGGVVAEEVNVVPLADLLNTSTVENFGWGMRKGAMFGREGTFAVGRGEMLTWGTPPCLSDLSDDQQIGFIKPYIQFGRSPGVPLHGITSSVMSELSFPNIKLAAAEFNTGTMIVTKEDYDVSGPSSVNFVKLYKEDSNGNLVLLENGFNSLVAEDLSLGPNESLRGDARLFKYPDGTAGVFIERTGQFFKLHEAQSPTCTAIPLGHIDDLGGDARLFKYPDGTAGVFIERTGQFFNLVEVRPTFQSFIPGSLKFSNTDISGLSQARRNTLMAAISKTLTQFCPGLSAGVEKCVANILKVNGEKFNSSQNNPGLRKFLRRLQNSAELEVEFELILTSYCAQSDCTDAETVANAAYSQTTGALRTAINNGSLVSAVQSTSSDISSLLNDAVASGDFSELVLPILAFLVWYPDWGSSHTCINDGNPPAYMKIIGTYLENSLLKCCERYFSWDYFTCAGSSATLPSGFYPSWGSSETKCLESSDAMPDYMKRNPTQWLYEDIESCCEQHYSWEFSTCIQESGGNPLATSTGKWYVNHEERICQQDCPETGNVTCGGLANSWDILYESSGDCCEGQLSWISSAVCTAQSTSSPIVGSSLWFIDWDSEKCVKDCETSVNSDCGGLASGWDHLYGDASECCDRLWWIERSECTA
eukprot:CAMPEP_0172574500 /NCGR_PEP_ID=MMETSP1067-20121228/136730_1 /TAXON_ID=265564 ORGANISM="Thalassiosira punctigera, Strain Tpunct2005C2" /NCGR_SAMPLE_ID=MMETSP1067 /ASSEMBLY_ACC=CAM_ASM_000444 /LENGTH=908 /DNA_ID=CAMNT_0013367129 /DNA_START=168 /DNA_END=2895 /DNA_ORIENTATION=-